MNELISIIVPVYNVEKELPRCVNSLINQTYKNIEIILVDDGSLDNSGVICDEYEKSDSRIKVIHKNNGGLSDARNVGLREATGDYILYVDSDDFIKKDSCQRFIRLLTDKPDIVVSNACEKHKNYVSEIKHSNLDEGKIYTGDEYIMLATKVKEWYAPACFNLYSREFLIQNNLFFVKGLVHEDMQMLPRVFLKARTIKYLDYMFYQYIIRDNSITQNTKKEINGKHLMKIYTEWKCQFDLVTNKKLRKRLYGILIKHYFHTCKEYKMDNDIYIPGVNKFFIITNTLDIREFIKATIFVISRKLYYRL
ncbi:glycosyltransferase [Clostridium perfringens]|uniref:Glycosyltransferase n=1 Tax=Clostridium perfringens TaxID=1502 RepID=A0AAN5SFH5_CLOPF|nr:glycosyltransferase [Clostridium perfringens]MBO3338120.1 glycosyltransferase [Clostridium perfringens]MBO3385687.1 glycosyltransferase [Clostridium perfringens]MBO3398132.1 glycosyltransferase [Clostridium perfringens]MBO3417195.1 glycosyltransferase [Clostridium perfringens]MBO3420352.1 glycosyltransferase [Clostridium perfringens]